MLNQWFMRMERGGAGLNHLAARASKFVGVCIMRAQVRTRFCVRIYRLNHRWMTFHWDKTKQKSQFCEFDSTDHVMVAVLS